MPTLTLKLDLDASAIDSALTDYATRVSTVSIGTTANADVFTEDSGSGADVWFSSDEAGSSPIDAKLLYWSDADSKFGFDVEIASVSSVGGATIYLQVGGKPVGYGTDPYDASTEVRSPLMDSLDDVAASLTGTSSGTATLTPGGITGPDGSLPATDFDNAAPDNHYIDYGNQADILFPLTLSGWIKADSVQPFFAAIVARRAESAYQYHFREVGVSSDALSLLTTGGSATSSLNVSDATWQYAAVSVDSSGNATFFLDGSTDTAAGMTISSKAVSLKIGYGGTSTSTWNGGLAGIGVDSTNRATAWHSANYRLQGSSAATYWTVTDVTAVGGVDSGAVFRRRYMMMGAAA